MINCFVRALRRRRPSIREGLEAAKEDKDFQVTVRSGAHPHETGQGLIICKPKSAFGQSGNETDKAANCDYRAANFSRNCKKAPEVTNR
jgi:hypothetical protein